MLDKLQPGEALRITNDHDPRPLRFELDHDHPNKYTFNYLESGPETWLVDIVRSGKKGVDPKFELLAECHGVSVSVATFEAGTSLPSHKIGDTVAVIVAEGALLLRTPSRRRQLSAGGVDIVLPHIPHALESLKPTKAYIVRVRLDHGSS